MAEGELAGDPVNEIEADGEDDVDADGDEDREKVGVEAVFKDGIQRPEGGDEQRDREIGNPRGELRGRHTFSGAVRPNRPLGLISRIKINTMKTNASA